MKLAIHGCYHLPNFGDLLLHDILVNWLREKWQIEPVTLDPYDPKTKATLFSIGKRVLRSCRCDFAVLGGGGYFVADPGGNPHSLLRYYFPTMAWRMTGVPYAIICVGAGPAMNARTSMMTRSMFRNAKVACVRDDASKEVLQHSGVNVTNVKVCADLVFTLRKAMIPASAMRRARDLLQPTEGQRILGMHFQHAATNQQCAEAVVQTIQRSVKRSDQVRLVWFFDHTDRSAPALRQLSDKYLPQAEMISFQDHWTTCAMISMMDAVWTSKLHVGIVASIFKKPVYGYSAHGKTIRFFEQIDRSKFQKELGSDPEIFETWMNDFMSDRPEPINTRRLDHLRERAEAGLELLESQFGGLGAESRQL